MKISVEFIFRIVKCNRNSLNKVKINKLKEIMDYAKFFERSKNSKTDKYYFIKYL